MIEKTGEWKKIDLPLDDDLIESFRQGDKLLLSGIFYSARDKAHERLCKLAANGSDLPFETKGEILYYVGPSPAKGDNVIGSAGPTTSYRMDPFTEPILKMGIKGMIGKGRRDRNTRDLLMKYRAVYFSSIGGAAAYLSEKIVESTVIAFDDLGPEAIRKMVVKDFPVVVINDIYGGDLYESASGR